MLELEVTISMPYLSVTPVSEWEGERKKRKGGREEGREGERKEERETDGQVGGRNMTKALTGHELQEELYS